MKPSRPLYRSAYWPSRSKVRPRRSTFDCSPTADSSRRRARSGFRISNFFAFLPRPRPLQRSDKTSGAGNNPGNEASSLKRCGARCNSEVWMKFRASGTSLFDNSSNCRSSVQRNSPLVMSCSDRTRQRPRYDPMSKRAGETTGWFMSLVGHMRPTTRRRDSSGRPGQVFDVDSVTPCESPRFKFFCIRLSFSTKCSAD